MSSEAITRNDLKAILDEVLPPSASEYKKLLWTNPSPTSTFSAQTISLDLSEYDDVEVEFKVYPSEDVVNVASAGIGEVGVCSTVRTDTWLTQARTFTVSATGVAFSDCRLGSNASVYNNHSVPLNIYGIKYERVAPPQLDASDYVIEQGTSGIWTYRKWDSGIAECWGTTSKSISGVSKTAPFSGYCYEIGVVAFPTGLFISTPTATVSGRLDSNYVCVSYSPVSTSSVSVELQANVSGTRTAYAYINALGRWK